MEKNKPLILVVNDDGISSKGIRFLVELMCDLGEVYVVAPQSNRSGLSHAMTLNKEISVQQIKKNEFTCSGTPVDCVKLAFNKILPRKPDLCVSGINHGSNHSINGLYSGTLHAAMEATIHGVSSISLSHLSYEENTSFDPFGMIIKKISHDVIQNRLPAGVTLNINIPDIPYDHIRGVKLCNQGKGFWEETFELKNHTATHNNYLITGKFNDDKTDVSTDSWALHNNFISLVPVGLNTTSLNVFPDLKYLENDFT